ncbi:MAG: hypothetical protein V3V47_05150, partial [Desulfobacteria bacterium]
DEQGRTSPPASPERSRWRAGVFVEAYRRTDSTPQTAFSQAARRYLLKPPGANPRRTPLIGQRAIYGWKLERISKMWIRVQGKAGGGEKAQHTR